MRAAGRRGPLAEGRASIPEFDLLAGAERHVQFGAVIDVMAEDSLQGGAAV